MIAFLGDVHANVPALEAVLDFCRSRGVTTYYAVGDLVGYYAFPAETLQLLQSNDVRSAQGNHDAAVGLGHGDDDVVETAADVFRWTRKALSAQDLASLAELPMTFDAESSGFRFRVVHAAVVRPWSWPYIQKLEDASRLLHIQDCELCVYGHTHRPWHFRLADDFEEGPLTRLQLDRRARYLVNVGSVGQPRDGDPRAQVVTFDADSRVLELHRVTYDTSATASAQLDAGLPAAPIEYLRS